uniref:Uncharacterized protein n=1 Tax=Lotus japonicus TaxID=34305 RepID=I3SCA2_LOTJA|nr:unknown [Lotus japonicus]
MLKAEVASLTEKVLARENLKQVESETKGLVEPPQRPLLDSFSEGEESKVSVGACKHEDISSARSESLDSDSPRYRDGYGVNSAVLETCDSFYVVEPDQSDMSQDEEDNLTKTLLPPYMFSKLGDMDYSDPPESSCNFGFPKEDHALWSWSY